MAEDPQSRSDLRSVMRSGRRGTATWWSAAEVERSYRRWAGAVVFFVAMALLWTTALFGEDGGDNLSGFILVELFTAIPLTICATRLRQVQRIRRHATIPVREQIDRVEAEQSVDAAMHHLNRLVARLPDQVRRDHGREVTAAAERSAVEWRKLLRRAADLRVLLSTAGTRSRSDLIERLRSTEADASTLKDDMDRLASALAGVADASDDDDLAEVTARVELAEERMLLFAEAMSELRDGTTQD